MKNDRMMAAIDENWFHLFQKEIVFIAHILHAAIQFKQPDDEIPEKLSFYRLYWTQSNLYNTA